MTIICGARFEEKRVSHKSGNLECPLNLTEHVIDYDSMTNSANESGVEGLHEPFLKLKDQNAIRAQIEELLLLRTELNNTTILLRLN